ncbi:MAG: hypothetical protein ACTHW1_05595 [Ancrocorticia sp.]|uniref:hypothetical protein n=1 Tax=Ancrocorticia sp. TaxID=2593684 RepID=UPI003F915E4F
MQGIVTAISYPGAGLSPLVRVQLQLGDDSVTLAFLGRQDVHAIDIGSRLRARGALVDRRGVPTLYDPEITVLADSSSQERV